MQAIYRKVYLPNYGVFDEERYFQVGAAAALIEVGGARVGLTICEDIWEPGPPLSDEALAGATVVVNLSASPYHAGKGGEREHMLVQRARDSSAAVAFCNLVGGQDELVFDGHSVVVDHEGTVIARAHQFARGAARRRHRPRGPARRAPARHPPPPGGAAQAGRGRPPRPASRRAPEERRRAPGGDRAAARPATPRSTRRSSSASATTSRRTASAHVVLGLSGGIDSALVACLAVDASAPSG